MRCSDPLCIGWHCVCFESLQYACAPPSMLLHAGHGVDLSPAAALAACLSGAAEESPAAGARGDVLLALLRATPAPGVPWCTLMASLLAADGPPACTEENGHAMDAASNGGARGRTASGDLEPNGRSASAEQLGSGPGASSDPAVQEQCAAAASAAPGQRLRLAALLVERLAASLGSRATTMGHRAVKGVPSMAIMGSPEPREGDPVSAASERPAGTTPAEGVSADDAEAWRGETLDWAATRLVSSPLLASEPAAAQVRADCHAFERAGVFRVALVLMHGL